MTEDGGSNPSGLTRGGCQFAAIGCFNEPTQEQLKEWEKQDSYGLYKPKGDYYCAIHACEYECELPQWLEELFRKLSQVKGHSLSHAKPRV